MRTWSGVIVFTDDFSPIVGESDLVPGFFACVSSTGFTFSPLFARQLAERMIDPGLGKWFPGALFAGPAAAIRSGTVNG